MVPVSADTRPAPFGLLVAPGVFLMMMSVVVPFLLGVLTLKATYPDAIDPVWSFVVPAATLVLTFGFAARVIANGGSRRRPVRALVHLVLGCGVLAMAVSLTVEATGIVFVRF
ncbi:hypothetical protein [Litorihabitans aurantiacus]|uniref:Uncharacterized protein n=1 Tax=Litorihabitans aurantiacus TaxID=1930061 RepID=A0AA37UHD6_9MICO|nr:hypothetical protein [Litorihabitans aurantiacus]GMA30738.1 hypothetical protein GCM10025875_07300 [Litorihabitans aurantiacus]